MDEAKVSSVITNSNKELIFILFFLFTGLFVPYRLYYALNGFNVYTLGGFILVPLMGRIKFGFQVDRLTKLSLDYLNVLAGY